MIGCAGKYMTDCRAEFPASWFAKARLAGKVFCIGLFGFGEPAVFVEGLEALLGDPFHSLSAKKSWASRSSGR